MRVTPVLIMNRAGLWLFDFGVARVDEGHLVDVLREVRENLETHVPHWPCCVNLNGDFMSGPTCVVEKAGGGVEALEFLPVALCRARACSPRCRCGSGRRS